MNRKLFVVSQALVFLLFVTAIGVAAHQIDSANSIVFTDVPSTNPFYANINHLTDAGIVGGYNDPNVCGAGQTPCFKPFNNVTRGQTAKFIDNARTQPGIAIHTSTTVTTPYDLTPLTSQTDLANGIAIQGTAEGGAGVKGISNKSNMGGVYGTNGGAGGFGMLGTANVDANSIGVYGGSDPGTGVKGYSVTGVGASGQSIRGEAGVKGINGEGNGVYGISIINTGVRGESTTGLGVYGESGQNDGVTGRTFNGSHSGVSAFGTGNGSGIYATSETGWAGYFDGDINVTGNCTGCLAATYQIDNPADPANSLLNYNSVASTEGLNIYTGNATIGADGAAIVKMPTWVEQANSDFRYTITPIGAFAPLYVAQTLSGGQFKIAGGTPGMKVSWQVSAVRSDPWSKQHTAANVVEKTGADKGKYLYPQGYDQPATSLLFNGPVGSKEAATQSTGSK